LQSAGHGFRLKAQLMKDEFNRAGPVLHLLLRYTQALITLDANGSMQPTPYARPAIVPMAVAKSGSSAGQ
jgi:hypothetical protein